MQTAVVQRRCVIVLAVLVLCLSAVTLLAPSAVAQVPVPQIDNLVPSQGPVGTFVLINGSDFGPLLAGNGVFFNGTEAVPLVWQTAFIYTRVPDGATTGPVTVVTAGGESNGVDFTVTAPPAPSQTWYLAEGSTAWGFETFIAMQNTTNSDATVNIIYNSAQYGRLPRPQPLNVPPNSRVTLNLNDDLRLPLDVSTEIISSQNIVCERAMYWGNRLEGTDSVGVTGPSQVWYLAEGCTTWPFETWICIQNPSVTTTANIDITYMTPNNVVEKETFGLGAGQRRSIDVSKDVGATDVSARVVSDQDVVCERAMYWSDRRGGHASIGAVQPSSTWFLAEGSTAWGFDTYVCIQNPNDEPTDVEVTFMTGGGPVGMPAFTMPANSRQNVYVNEHVNNNDTSIEVISDDPVVAERAMYWNNGTGKAGHGTIGMVSPDTTVYLAEGSTAWGFETYVCVQNPGDEAVAVDVTYLTNSGPVPGRQRTVGARSRVTIKVSEELPNTDTSIRLTSSKPIMAERAMYWHNMGAGHCSIGWVPDF